jgi:hypothetical protein
VTKGGIAYISSGVVGGTDIDGLLFRLETWAKGSGYVGRVAASDEVWVMQIFNALKRTGRIRHSITSTSIDPLIFSHDCGMKGRAMLRQTQPFVCGGGLVARTLDEPSAGLAVAQIQLNY